MLKIIKTNTAFLAGIIIAMTAPLNACGEKTMIPNSLIHRFEHKIPESYNNNPDFSLEELQSFIDEGVLFLGIALGDPDPNTFDIGVQFETETMGRRVFVEKMVLDTPNLKTERIINEFIDIDLFNKNPKVYYKRFTPFEKINGDTIPVTADFFTLKVDYKLDDGPSKQMSIRFDNASLLVPDF